MGRRVVGLGVGAHGHRLIVLKDRGTFVIASGGPHRGELESLSGPLDWVFVPPADVQRVVENLPDDLGARLI